MFFFSNIFSVYHVVLRLEAYTKEYISVVFSGMFRYTHSGIQQTDTCGSMKREDCSTERSIRKEK